MPGGPMFSPRSVRCSMCNINFPPARRFAECPVCGSQTSMMFYQDIDEDWLQQAEELVVKTEGGVPDTPEAP